MRSILFAIVVRPQKQRVAQSAAIFALLCGSAACQSLPAQDLSGQTAEPRKYSAEVVEKADQALSEAGLRRSGKTLQAADTSSISRAITALTREKRELRLVAQDWEQVANQIALIKNQLQESNARDIELNLQLAQVAGRDVAANNRIVGMLNALRGQAKTLTATQEKLKQELARRRTQLNQAEAAYAESVLAIRKDYDAVRDRLERSINERKSQIAFQVLHHNFDTPASPTADQILAPLHQRIVKIEADIFNETIPLNEEGGGLMVDVVIDRKTVPMVIDSGATHITLPSRTAVELGVEVGADSTPARVRLATGDEIMAHLVTLPRVRVGQFEAADVDAIVLDAAATQAKPLLGLSFLSRFRFEIDQSSKSLKMLRVHTK